MRNRGGSYLRVLVTMFAMLFWLESLAKETIPAPGPKASASSDPVQAIGAIRAATAEKLSLDFVPPETAAILAVRPLKLFDDSGLKDFANLIDKSGIVLGNLVPIDQIDQLTGIQFAHDAEDSAVRTAETLPFDVLIVVVATPHNWAGRIKRLSIKVESVDLHKKRYYELGEKSHLAVWPIDAQHCVVADAVILKRLIERGHGKATKLSWAGGWSEIAQSQFAIAADPAWLRRKLMQPPGGQNEQALIGLLASLFQDAQSLVLGFSADDKPRGKAVIVCETPEEAEIKAQAFQSLLAVAQMFQQQANQNTLNLGAAQQQQLTETLALVDRLLKDAQVIQNDRQVVMSLQPTAKAPELLKTLMGLVARATGRGDMTDPFTEQRPIEKEQATESHLTHGALGNPILAARLSSSKTKLERIAVALAEYEHVNGSLPPRATFDSAGHPLLSWRVLILPQLGEQALFDQFHLNEAWSSAHNRRLLDHIPGVYCEPKNNSSRKPSSHAAIFALVGKHACMPPDGSIRRNQITDGPENTLWVVETRRGIPWTKPDDVMVRDDDSPQGKLGGFHTGGFVALFADGKVRFLTHRAIDRYVPALITISGNERIDGDLIADK